MTQDKKPNSIFLKKSNLGKSLAVQWLGLGSIPGWGTKIPQATGCNQKKKNIKPFDSIENYHHLVLCA